MAEEPDYELIPGGDDAPREHEAAARPVGVWIALVLLIVAAGIAVYIVFRGRLTPAPVETAAPVVETPAPPSPLGAEPAPVEVPPLGESDPVVRELVRALSSHPRVAAWLATEGLIRNFTTAVTNVAEGVTPAQHLAPLRPESGFRVVERGDDLYIDPASFQRYNGLADAAASIDPAGAAKVYATLKPRTGVDPRRAAGNRLRLRR
jgi:hypothetical protein